MGWQILIHSEDTVDWSHVLPILSLNFIFFFEDNDLFVTTSKSNIRWKGIWNNSVYTSSMGHSWEMEDLKNKMHIESGAWTEGKKTTEE